jgi:biotin carboxylase
MSGTGPRWFAFLESNTTGTGRDFCAAARARGLRPVLLTRDPGRYPYVADDGIATVVLDSSDADAVYEKCAALADGAGLAGITSSSEYFVATAARTAAKLGLPAPDGDAVARCRAKDVQRSALAAAGVAVPRFEAVGEVDEAVAAAADIGHPVVLKPVSGSGSVGVKLCRDPAQTRAWARELLGRARDERGTPVPSRILVEAAVVGPEFSVETFDDTVVTIVGKHTGPEPYYVETGHDVPAPATPATLAALGDTARAALAALGLGWGAAHTELRMSAEGPVVIEVNPRLAGGMIPVAVRAATGRDLVDEVIARAAGQDVPPAGPGAGHAAIRFLLAEGDGQERRVTAVEGLAAAAAAPGVVTAATTGTATVGRTLRITHSFQDRLGCVVATGASCAEAERQALDAARLIRIDLENQTATHEASEREGVGGR